MHVRTNTQKQTKFLAWNSCKHVYECARRNKKHININKELTCKRRWKQWCWDEDEKKKSACWSLRRHHHLDSWTFFSSSLSLSLIINRNKKKRCLFPQRNKSLWYMKVYWWEVLYMWLNVNLSGSLYIYI